MSMNGGRFAAGCARDMRRACLAALALASLLAWPAASQASDSAARGPAAFGKCDTLLRVQMERNSAKGWTSAVLWIDGQLTAERRAKFGALHVDVYRNLPVISSVAARIPNRNLRAVADLSFVKRLSSDATVLKNDEYTVEATGADVAFSKNHLTGKGITVAVLDSGLRESYDLTESLSRRRVLARVSFVPTDRSPDDQCGHGTHVAGIIGGNGKSSTGPWFTRTFYGVARRASLVSVRVLDEYGQGNVSAVLAGIQWCIDNRSRYGIRVLNLSLGHPVGESFTTDPLCRAAEAAWKSGIVVVCAAGNMGRSMYEQDPALDNEGYGTAYGSIQSPGNDPYVITVGAMKRMDGVRANDRIATYSSRGPSRLDFVVKPDIVAPGNRVISLDVDNGYLERTCASTNMVPKSYYMVRASNDASDSYFYLSGTSMAAPVVSGAAALMLEADPTLSPDTVKARLMIAADKWLAPNGLADVCTYGAGYLNIPAALACRYRATQASLSPMLVRDDAGSVFLCAYGDVTGTRAIWGGGNTSVVDATRAIWGPATAENTPALTNSYQLYGLNVWFDGWVWGEGYTAADLSMTTIIGEG